MKKSTISILLGAMMAVSGMATAQNADVRSGTQGGAGPSGASGMGDSGSSTRSRADVKSEINNTPAKSGIQGGEGASPSANPNTARTGAAGMTGSTGSSGMSGTGGGMSSGGMSKSRTEVRGEATPMKSGIQGGEAATPSANPNTAMTGSSKMSSTDRKMTMSERRASNRMKRSKRMSSGTGQKEGASSN